MRSMLKEVFLARATCVVAAAVLALASGPAMAQLLPPLLYDGTNNLAGRGYGLDENYVEPAGPPAGSPWYTMPNGFTSALNPGLGTAGMTETIFTVGRPGAPIGGLNLPQPALLSPGSGDRRAVVPNPFAGGLPVWGARTGGVFTWESVANFDGGMQSALLPFGTVTTSAYNITPLAFSSISPGGLLPDGLSPGSAAFDVFPDTIPFSVDFTGRRYVEFGLDMIDLSDFALFGHASAAAFAADPVTSNMLPIVEVWDTGDSFTLSNALLVETDFDHNYGAHLGESGDAADGTLLLRGYMADAAAVQKITETARGSGVFELDVSFRSTRTAWFGGSLVGSRVLASDLTDPTTWVGSNELSWKIIPFPVIGPGPYVPVAPGAGEFPNGSFDRNGLASYDFRPPPGSFSADLNFDVVIPEPVTAGMGALGLGSLGAYLLGRRRRR